ncbi:MAG: 30S ribosomal protein S9 [Chitinophagales bacterium]|nr:30S ribosomal protein S9 [Chitinophagales bacterium]MDW8427185.1 30S ribosomal protein S9 [Chitinophagales bacterium]
MPTIAIHVGRRKEASARVRLLPATDGQASITINGRDYRQYFPHFIYYSVLDKALQVAEAEGKYRIIANVSGGGVKGQVEAVRLGIARALVAENPELRPRLRAAGLLTRDPRAVERKKSGRKKARKRFQFSKR